MTQPPGEPWQWSLAAAAAQIRAGVLTPLELLHSVLGRIDAVEPSVRAFVEVDREGALSQAEALTLEARDGEFRGALHGIPVGIKDIFDISGFVTRCGSELFRDEAPASADAASVARLRWAGSVLVGKTATHELACGVYTESVRNPWDLSRSCGGSSGGSGAAVAAGEVMAATGSDTGGSIRIPAAVCGIVGIKPTYDLVSRAGVAALSWSLDHVGPLARSVEDAALVLGAMVGLERAGGEAWSIPETTTLAGVTFGIPDDEVLSRVHPFVRSAFDDTCSLLEDCGGKIVHISVPEIDETLVIAFAIIMAEGASYHARDLRERGSLISDGIRVLFEAGAVLPSQDYLEAQRLRAVLCRALGRSFAEHRIDVLCTPTIPLQTYAASDAEVTIDGRSEPLNEAVVRTTAPFNLAGLPVVAVPMGTTEDDLPVSVQFVGEAYTERRLIAIAGAYERLRGPLLPRSGIPLEREVLQ